MRYLSPGDAWFHSLMSNFFAQDNYPFQTKSSSKFDATCEMQKRDDTIIDERVKEGRQMCMLDLPSNS